MNQSHYSSTYFILSDYLDKPVEEVKQKLLSQSYKVFECQVSDQQFIKTADLDMSRVYIFVDNGIVKSLSIG